MTKVFCTTPILSKRETVRCASMEAFLGKVIFVGEQTFSKENGLPPFISVIWFGLSICCCLVSLPFLSDIHSIYSVQGYRVRDEFSSGPDIKSVIFSNRKWRTKPHLDLGCEEFASLPHPAWCEDGLGRGRRAGGKKEAENCQLLRLPSPRVWGREIFTFPKQSLLQRSRENMGDVMCGQCGQYSWLVTRDEIKTWFRRLLWVFCCPCSPKM